MTVKRLVAIGVVFAGAALAWFILGSTLLVRSDESSTAARLEVGRLWGGPQIQLAPTACFDRPKPDVEQVIGQDEEGRPVTRMIDLVEGEPTEPTPIALHSSRVAVDLDLDHRRKGLLWHDTYDVVFDARYIFRLPHDLFGPVRVSYHFPSPVAIYDGFVLRVDGNEVFHSGDLASGITTWATGEPGGEMVVEVAYRSRGLDTWRYAFVAASVAKVRDFQLVVDTDFERVDFPGESLSPTQKRRTAEGWQLEWRFDRLVSGKAIEIDLPNRLNPGPLTARITFFAPVSLLFFFTLLVVLDILGHLRLHPAHYFFLSAAFFAFHLLIAYLVDHVDIHLAFVLASLTSLGLVVSYLRLVCGLDAALRYAGAAQLFYLVLFSYAFFFAGYTGLTVTIASVLTLFLLMQLTGKVDWESALRSSPGPQPAGDAA